MQLPADGEMQQSAITRIFNQHPVSVVGGSNRAIMLHLSSATKQVAGQTT